MKYVEPLKDGLKSIPCAILRASARFSLAAKFDFFFLVQSGTKEEH